MWLQSRCPLQRKKSGNVPLTSPSDMIKESEIKSGALGKLQVLGAIQKYDGVRFQRLKTGKEWFRLFLRRNGLTLKRGEKKRLKDGWDILLWEFVKRARWVTAVYDACTTPMRNVPRTTQTAYRTTDSHRTSSSKSNGLMEINSSRFAT